jgi:hypothetical protein
LPLRDEENSSVCQINHSTHSKPKTWLPINVHNEPMKYLLAKHFKMCEALRLIYVLKREIMSLKRKLSKIQIEDFKCVAQWA